MIWTFKICHGFHIYDWSWLNERENLKSMFKVKNLERNQRRRMRRIEGKRANKHRCRRGGDDDAVDTAAAAAAAGAAESWQRRRSKAAARVWRADKEFLRSREGIPEATRAAATHVYLCSPPLLSLHHGLSDLIPHCATWVFTTYDIKGVQRARCLRACVHSGATYVGRRRRESATLALRPYRTRTWRSLGDASQPASQPATE